MYVDAKTLKDLEWSTILKNLSRHATSELGKELCMNLLPTDDLEDAQKMLRQTTEAKTMYQQAVNPSLGGIRNLNSFLKKAEIGSILDPPDFIDIASTLTASKSIKAHMKDFQQTYPLIFEITDLLLDHDSLLTEINKCFDNSGNLQDTASVHLKHLKDSLRDQTNNLKDKLNAIISNRATASYLQQPTYTIRNDRYVVPVKAEHKSDMPGIVHDSSASGVTYYIEPRAIVDLNNKLKETELQVDHEIQRILSSLTHTVAENAERIYVTLEFLAELDLIFAKAKYSSSIDAGEPELNRNKIIDLKRVRHPILVSNIKKVIANNVQLGNEYNTLIITGSNTGGKTVLLKTLGLCVLMTGAGLHIPAESDSSVYLYSSVFSDIGEEQSLEHNLSTFSAKMTNIINIVNKSNEDSLVLLDELGAGTDPAEGTALAQAILETLNEKQAFTVVTTHYGGLKSLAFSHQGFSNASVEFDFETLKPTYRLLLGMPGKSNATTIAKNLGLKKDIINRAEEIYSSSVDDFSHMIDDLQKKQQDITRELDIVKAEKEEATQYKKEYEQLLARMNNTKDQALNSFRKQLNNEISKAKSEAIEILEELKANKSEKAAKRAHSKLSEVSYKGRSKHDALKTAIRKSDQPEEINWGKIKKGDPVHIKKLEQDAILISMPDHQGKVVVQMGLVKTTLKKSDLLTAKKPKKVETPKPSFKVKGSVTKAPRPQDASMKCDLRGKTVEEGLYELELFLDRAALMNMSPIYVIHGHGTGALRKAVRQFLKETNYIKDFRPGEQSEGGDGVSIVEL